MPRYYNSYYNNYEVTYPWKDTVSKIYALRRNGDLDQALTLARLAHERYPDEDDVTKAYGWTLHSVCKQAIEKEQLEFAQGLFENEYKALTFSDSDEFVENLRRSFLIIAKQLNPFSCEIESAIKESKEENPKSAAEKMLKIWGGLYIDTLTAMMEIRKIIHFLRGVYAPIILFAVMKNPYCIPQFSMPYLNCH